MNDKSKLILKIWFILFTILFISKLLNTLNDSLLPNLSKISVNYLNIPSVILFAYVLDRGEEKIAKFGIISAIIYLIIGIMTSFKVINILNSTSFVINVFSLLKIVSTYILLLFEFLALFSLMPTNSNIVDKAKKIAIGSVILVSLLGVFFGIFSLKSQLAILRVLANGHIPDYFKYAVIILYLLNKVNDKSIQSTSNSFVNAMPTNSNITLTQTIQNVGVNTSNQIANSQTIVQDSNQNISANNQIQNNN